MFQDIIHNYNIEYDDKSVNDNDIILAYSDRKMLYNIDNENNLCLPHYSDLDIKRNTTDILFLFSLNGIRFFLWKAEQQLKCKNFSYENINRLKSVNVSDFLYAAVTGYHYYSFHEENKFCGKCGEKLAHVPEKRCMLCDSCKNEIFPKISPAVIVGVIDDKTDSILMTRYAQGDYKKLALVAGFAEMGESGEQAAYREVMEETGIEICDLKYYKSQPWGFAQNLLIGYFAKLKGKREIVLDKTELSEALWVKREDVKAQPNSISLTGEMLWKFKNNEV
ncbi:MAG: NAD(+) diphosphatase [Ruminococcus sp.]|nr:NAD(+) diphosphatase [Ruminococcus sp.]